VSSQWACTKDSMVGNVFINILAKISLRMFYLYAMYYEHVAQLT